MTDADLVRVLRDTKTIAMVGAHINPVRPAHKVGNFLVGQGYRVIPVNPGHAGKTLFGETIVATLADAADADMVEIFRTSDAVPGIVKEALAHLPNLRTIWMQLGIHHALAAETARAHGITVIQDRCPAIEIPRLGLTR